MLELTTRREGRPSPNDDKLNLSSFLMEVQAKLLTLKSVALKIVKVATALVDATNFGLDGLRETQRRLFAIPR